MEGAPRSLRLARLGETDAKRRGPSGERAGADSTLSSTPRFYQAGDSSLAHFLYHAVFPSPIAPWMSPRASSAVWPAPVSRASPNDFDSSALPKENRSQGHPYRFPARPELPPMSATLLPGVRHAISFAARISTSPESDETDRHSLWSERSGTFLLSPRRTSTSGLSLYRYSESG
jgi:hypothetical protein